MYFIAADRSFLDIDRYRLYLRLFQSCTTYFPQSVGNKGFCKYWVSKLLNYVLHQNVRQILAHQLPTKLLTEIQCHYECLRQHSYLAVTDCGPVVR
ncbi:hypothetical protein K443DRAFT_439097 [Laccaria amethystina LaAM-08-1]|uniref:Uncharacterized protein n=1 Tax=Laccaria amethystina LaAM-08-1 TaxID=1095629 RepID=A0A0C9WUR0_9AGAR|nr:hypothetical protein K443DRAFT_439097 [Laccaria amethystina LaAM-08-1]